MSTAVHTLENISSDLETQRQARERENAQLMLRHLVLAAAKESKAEGIIEGKVEGQRDSVRLVSWMLRIQPTAAQEKHLAT